MEQFKYIFLFLESKVYDYTYICKYSDAHTCPHRKIKRDREAKMLPWTGQVTDRVY